MNAEIFSSDQIKKMGPVFNHFSFDNHEQIVFCNDEDTGLKAIIGIHNTVLGPALGGTRMWNYQNEWEALYDVLRLSRGMTFKSAVAGLDLGGGKAVIIGDAKKQKNDVLMKRFAEFVHSLSGRYITAEDIGMETRDMDIMKQVTPYVSGISENLGGSGNPSPVTAFGVFMGIKASCKYKFGSESVSGKKVWVQGVGNVGETLVKYLTEAGAEVFITDIYQDKLKAVSNKYGATIYNGIDVFSQNVDIYAPCALGATINDQSIEKLKASIIAGGANNQLEDENKHGKLLKEKGIIYAPDFLINAGGIINVNAEVAGYDRAETMKRTENIYNTTLEIFNLSDQEGITTHQAALNIALKRIESRRKELLK
jgi:leucine dehydrogenase